jgi:uncharacterized DUF497 family protein
VHMRGLWGLSGTSARRGRTCEKHRVDFADAATVFEDNRAVTVAEDDPEGQRYVTIGMDALARVLVLVYTMRGERIRIFPRAGRPAASARNTSKVYETRIRFQQG